MSGSVSLFHTQTDLGTCTILFKVVLLLILYIKAVLVTIVTIIKTKVKIVTLIINLSIC